MAAIIIGVITNLAILDINSWWKQSTQHSTSTPLAPSPTVPASIQPTSPPLVVITPPVTPTPRATYLTKVTDTVKAQELFIPLSGGSTQNDQWEDVSGTDVTIDTASYSSIKQAYFEASLSVPTKNGIVYARLFNVTDKHPVWFSEIGTGNEQSTLIRSAPIQLDKGNKTYRVQMRTTLRYVSLMSSGRIRLNIQ